MPDAMTVARKQINFFYVLDTSGSMLEDGAIVQLNQAMRNTIRALIKVEEKLDRARTRVSVLQFASGCSWMNPDEAEDVRDLEWTDLAAGGQTNVGAAIEELSKKMKREELLESGTGIFMPVIIFMTDGRPTDPERYPKALAEAQKNKYYRDAIKIGFALGDNADFDFVAAITKLF